jgi:hypothetical protein
VCLLLQQGWPGVVPRLQLLVLLLLLEKGLALLATLLLLLLQAGLQQVQQ